MAIVGSSFTKIDVDRKKPVQGKVSINNNVAISDVSKADINVADSKDMGLKFVYQYDCVYTPDIGHIKLTGDLLVIEKGDVAKEILTSWEGKKEVPKDYMTMILNAVLTKCNVQSLILSQTMNLPPPIPMPKVSVDAAETVEEKKTGKKDSK